MIDRGSIVRGHDYAFIDWPGGRWEDHFVPVRKLFVAMEAPSNNGNFKAKDSRGRVFWLNALGVQEV